MKKTLGWSGIPTAATVRPPRNGPMSRQRSSPNSLGSYPWGAAREGSRTARAVIHTSRFLISKSGGVERIVGAQHAAPLPWLALHPFQREAQPQGRGIQSATQVIVQGPRVGDLIEQAEGDLQLTRGRLQREPALARHAAVALAALDHDGEALGPLIRATAAVRVAPLEFGCRHQPSTTQVRSLRSRTSRSADPFGTACAYTSRSYDRAGLQ